MVWLASRLPGFSVGSAALWAFLRRLAQPGMSTAAAWEVARTGFSLESARRWARRVHQLQPYLRACLCRVHDPPQHPHTKNPLSQTIMHLELAMAGVDPVKSFQSLFQTNPMQKDWAGGICAQFPS